MSASTSSRRSASSNVGLRARDVARHEAELARQQQYEQEQLQQQQQQRWHNETRLPSRPSQMGRQSSLGGLHEATGTSTRSRRAASNASRTSTVLSGAGARGKQKASGTSLTTPYEEPASRTRGKSPGRTTLSGETPLHDSPLRRWCRLVEKTSQAGKVTLASSSAKKRLFWDHQREWAIAVSSIVFVKWTVGLGGWSGKGHPPLYGDMEAQRHWLSLTKHLPISHWYYHDLPYWGLDYPPLTAYHSLLLAKIATLVGHPQVAELRNRLGGKEVVHREEEAVLYLRSTVIVGDLLIYAIPVAIYCAVQLGKWGGRTSGGNSSKRSMRTMMLAFYSIMLQPSLILIDSGHFQYNSLMLGLTLLSLISLTLGRDVLGAVFFVLSMCFKQMALYYAPGIFAYLLGKCFYLGNPRGLNLFVSLAFFSTLTLGAVFAPFVVPLSNLGQAIHRIFPLARGLFEDKVANAWCALNVVVKLREVASVQTLARLSAVLTLATTLPLIAGLVYLSIRLHPSQSESEEGSPEQAYSTPKQAAPTAALLPHTLFASAMAFYLFSFQVHEKSILLPLMPLTLLLAGRQPGLPGEDWEWAILLNNVGVFSMYPLLKRDGLALPSIALTLFWNFALGYNPFSLSGLTSLLSLAFYALSTLLLFVETITSPPAHLPDLFVVLNVLLCFGFFGLGWLWSLKRLVEEGWGMVGLGLGQGGMVGAKDEQRRMSRSPSMAYSPLLSPDIGLSSTARNGEIELDGLPRREKRRSTSVASSSRTAMRDERRRTKASLSPFDEGLPYIDDNELEARENGLRSRHSSSKSHSRNDSTVSRSTARAQQTASQRRLSSSSTGQNPSAHLFPSDSLQAEQYSGARRGDYSTAVSPSKTTVFDAGMAEEARWKQGMMSQFAR